MFWTPETEVRFTSGIKMERAGAVCLGSLFHMIIPMWNETHDCIFASHVQGLVSPLLLQVQLLSSHSANTSQYTLQVLLSLPGSLLYRYSLGTRFAQHLEGGEILLELNFFYILPPIRINCSEDSCFSLLGGAMTFRSPKISENLSLLVVLHHRRRGTKLIHHNQLKLPV